MERRRGMGTVRWAVSVVFLILLVKACWLNWHHKYFNFFILGLFLLNYGVIVLFWLTCKWQGLANAKSVKEEQTASGSRRWTGEA